MSKFLLSKKKKTNKNKQAKKHTVIKRRVSMNENPFPVSPIYGLCTCFVTLVKRASPCTPYSQPLGYTTKKLGFSGDYSVQFTSGP